VILDMSDVDSEKWFQYAAMRRGAFLFAAEGRRLRQEEILYTARARHTIVMTAQERNLLRSFSPSATISYVENGVDFDSFDPASVSPPPGLRSRKFLAFIGYMDYYPNVQAVVWFADHVFGCLQKRIPDLEFAIVGRNPRASVLALARRPGIWVAPQPSDVRPYLMASAGVVAPLHLARGIQNKVLEALAMGKTVFASTPICSTFGPDLPAGIVQCRDTAEFIRRISAVSLRPAASDPSIRAAAQARFSWPRALDSISQTVLATVDSARSMEKV
jgi:glycosyltransferase involved in cell wall biosynthesis